MVYFGAFTRRTACCGLLHPLMSFQDGFIKTLIKMLSLRFLKRHYFWSGCPRKATVSHYPWVLSMVPVYRKYSMNVRHP